MSWFSLAGNDSRVLRIRTGVEAVGSPPRAVDQEFNTETAVDETTTDSIDTDSTAASDDPKATAD